MNTEPFLPPGEMGTRTSPQRMNTMMVMASRLRRRKRKMIQMLPRTVSRRWKMRKFEMYGMQWRGFDLNLDTHININTLDKLDPRQNLKSC